MKKINFLIIATLCCSLHSLGQSNIKSYVADISLPKEANKMTKEQTLSLINNRYKKTMMFRSYNNVYYIGNIIVYFEDMYNGDDELTLSRHKQSTEGFNKRYGSKIIESKIITVNNIQFFVFEYQEGDEINLTFTPDFKNKETIYCEVKYKIEDEAKAQKIFNSLMSSFRYKN